MCLIKCYVNCYIEFSNLIHYNLTLKIVVFSELAYISPDQMICFILTSFYSWFWTASMAQMESTPMDSFMKRHAKSILRASPLSPCPYFSLFNGTSKASRTRLLSSVSYTMNFANFYSSFCLLRQSTEVFFSGKCVPRLLSFSI